MSRIWGLQQSWEPHITLILSHSENESLGRTGLILFSLGRFVRVVQFCCAMLPVVPMFSALQDLSQQLVVKSTFLDVTDGLSDLVNEERLLINVHHIANQLPNWKRIHKGTFKKNTLLRVIPTMTFIYFLTGKSSGILFGISSGFFSGILSGISSDILSDISSGILSGILSDISSGILSGISSGILSGKSSGILSGISCGILSIWHFYLAFYLAYLVAFYLVYLLAFYLAYLLAFYLAYLMAFSLAYLLAFYLTFYLAYLLAFYLAVEVQRAHWAGKVPGWGPAVHIELGRSRVEVQRCTQSWAGPRLRFSGAHWAGKVPG